MEESDNEEQVKKKAIKVITFPVPFASIETKEYISTPSKYSKEKIINEALKFHSQGNLSEATKHYEYFINQGFKDHRAFSNYGAILADTGNLNEAEIYIKEAIKLHPNNSNDHKNLGMILINKGQLYEAKEAT